MSIKTLILCIFSTMFICFSASALADNWNYSIIVDAGSSGSRLHLFRYQMDANALPIIEDISVTPNQTKIPLASANVSSIDDLLSAAITALNTAGIDPKTVPIRIYGTAGMRLLTQDQQREIYRAVYTHLGQYPFSPIIVRTILGEEEAIYDWLDVNYLKKTFTDSSETVGIIDVGGASMEIAFDMPPNMQFEGTTSVFIHGKNILFIAIAY